MISISPLLLNKLGRHALVVVGMIIVLLPCILLNCKILADSACDASVSAPQSSVIAEDAAGNAHDPDDCGRCHCLAPGAIIEGQGVIIPAPIITHNVLICHPDQAPSGMSFAPDPPPDRA